MHQEDLLFEEEKRHNERKKDRQRYWMRITKER